MFRAACGLQRNSEAVYLSGQADCGTRNNGVADLRVLSLLSEMFMKRRPSQPSNVLSFPNLSDRPMLFATPTGGAKGLGRIQGLVNQLQEWAARAVQMTPETVLEARVSSMHAVPLDVPITGNTARNFQHLWFMPYTNFFRGPLNY
jgi:hypothetical protein